MNEDNNNINFSDDIDSCSSTPFVSAPSSPGRNIPISSGFYFSAPSSPMHYILSTSSHKSHSSSSSSSSLIIDSSFEFDLPSSGAASADELFFNGQIRPMNLQRPQLLDTLIEEEQNDELCRGREMMKIRAGSLRRRTRSMSPIRNFGREIDKNDTDDLEVVGENVNGGGNETTPRSSSKRWIFLKEFLYRSKSEGRKHDGQHSNKFWSFSPTNKEKVSNKANNKKSSGNSSNKSEQVMMKKKVVNGNRVGKRNSVAVSAHEMHYTAKRAQAEEMRKRTFLPYRQGLLGCLGFSSKSFGAMNGFAKVLNPPTVSSTS